MSALERTSSRGGGAVASPTRRALLAAGAFAGVWREGSPSRAAAPEGRTLVETRLFNFREAASPAETEETLRRLRAFAAGKGARGVFVGRNLNGVPFPTRFEWLFMLGRPEAGGASDAAAQLTGLLSPACGSLSACELLAPLPPGFAGAPGVGVRHTVLFDFKPGTSPAARRRNVEAIREMGRLPMVRSYVVEPNAAFGSDPSQMEWQVIGDFDSLADYKAYADAPIHLSIRDDFQANTARVAFIDVKVRGADGAG